MAGTDQLLACVRKCVVLEWQERISILREAGLNRHDIHIPRMKSKFRIKNS